MNIIKYRNWFFAFSLIVIIPGLIALSIWGLKLGIDFTGGTLWEIKLEKPDTNAKSLQEFLEESHVEVTQAATTSQGTILMRLALTDEAKINEVKEKVKTAFGKYEETRLETVGPIVSKELTQKATVAVGLSVLAIMLYITWAFRKVAKPASPFAFGACTIIALSHDIIVVVGSFAILGHFFGTEIDSLFITALLTVLGFSVHDTIVVFDRIRENLKKHSDYPFEKTINHSLMQTIARSLNTSLTVVFVLLAMLLFGGQSIKTFILALLIGVVSGTYSSIFNAAPLLVVWNNLTRRRIKN